MKKTQKTLDRAVQKAKRQHWKKKQNELEDLYACPNTKEFWKYIGNLDIAQSRKKNIPFEVVLQDGSVSRDPDVVLNKWSGYYIKNC